MSGTPRPAPPDGRPPLGGWPRAYAAVIAELALTIALLLWLERALR